MYEEEIEKIQERLIVEQLDHEQTLVSKKKDTNGFSVERNFVNSKAFHDQFEREILPINNKIYYFIH